MKLRNKSAARYNISWIKKKSKENILSTSEYLERERERERDISCILRDNTSFG